MVMFSRNLLGMRWGDLSEDTRRMLLKYADMDSFNGAEGDRYSRGTLHFHNTMMGIQAAVETDRFSGDFNNRGIIIDDDAVISRI